MFGVSSLEVAVKVSQAQATKAFDECGSCAGSVAGSLVTNAGLSSGSNLDDDDSADCDLGERGGGDGHGTPTRSNAAATLMRAEGTRGRFEGCLAELGEHWAEVACVCEDASYNMIQILSFKDAVPTGRDRGGERENMLARRFETGSPFANIRLKAGETFRERTCPTLAAF